MFKAPHLETDRLILTWPTEEQINQYYNDIIGTNLFDTIVWDGPNGPEEIHGYWANAKKNNYADLSLNQEFSVINKETKKYMGGMSLRPINNNPLFVNIGYALAPKFHGKGYATEGVQAMINEAFKNRKAERIDADIFEGNLASSGVVKKIGFKFEGLMRKAQLKRGEFLNKELWAITKEDWQRINPQ